MKEGEKIIIYCDSNTEPPKNYLWAKSDNEICAWDKSTKSWVSAPIGEGRNNNNRVPIEGIKGTFDFDAACIDARPVLNDGSLHLLTILDPYDPNTHILLFFTKEAISENSMSVAIYTGEDDIIFDNINVEVDAETGDYQIVVYEPRLESGASELSQQILEVYGPQIKAAFENLDLETFMAIIGEPQVPTQQEI